MGLESLVSCHPLPRSTGNFLNLFRVFSSRLKPEVVILCPLWQLLWPYLWFCLIPPSAQDVSGGGGSLDRFSSQSRGQAWSTLYLLVYLDSVLKNLGESLAVLVTYLIEAGGGGGEFCFLRVGWPRFLCK